MKYKFEITNSPKELLKVAEYAKQLDIPIEGVAIMNTITFSSEKNLSVHTVKQHLTIAFESAGAKVWKIEGGKVE